MRPPRRCFVLLAVASCAKGGDVVPADGPGPDAEECTTVWYADEDGDGHGDPMSGAPACSQPAKTSATGDDCDDKDPYRFPGAPEVCDGVDNDCNSQTFEMCPANCQPAKRPPPDNGPTYLLCNSNANWPTARATCASVMGFHLIQIDDAGENAWVRTAATTAFGAVDIHIGASDGVAEGVWRWDGSDEQFWQGGSGGMAVNARFAAWANGEPNDDGTEDCAEQRPNGQWNDGSCGNGQRFVCER